MSWVAPPTFVSGNILTAAQLNILSGDLAETAAAKATSSGLMFLSSGPNTLVARPWGYATVDSDETTTSNFPTDLNTAGPIVTLTTGTRVMLHFGCNLGNQTAPSGAQMGVGVTGATTSTADVFGPWLRYGNETVTFAQTYGRFGGSKSFIGTVNQGSNTFTCKYGIIGFGTAEFSMRQLCVLPMN